MDDMTINEVSKALNVNEITVRRSIQKLFPEIMQNGIKTLLNEYHVTMIKRDLTTKKLDNNVEVTTELEEELFIAKAMQMQLNKIERLQNKLAQRENQIKRLIHSQKLYTTTEVAKELNLKSAQELNSILSDNNIQYKINNTWVLTAGYSDKNYVSIKQHELESGHVIYDRKWTGSGRDFLLRFFNDKD